MARKKSEMRKDDGKAEQTAAQEAASSAASGSSLRHEELKAALAKGGVLFGSRSVLKALKLKTPKIIFIASNCPESARNDINSAAKISGTGTENFEGTAKQMGVFCGKPFAIASLAVLEEKKK